MYPFPPQPTYHCLDRISASFRKKEKLIPIKSWMKLTKTSKASCEALLLNDLELQSDVLRWIDDRSSIPKILGRYKSLDPNFNLTQLPPHFAARVVNGVGAICSGQNIFLFFPDCLGLRGREEKDFFGIELIDVWANIFNRSVFPCAREVFTAESQVKLLSTVGGCLDKTIYLAALFHEVGHRVGSWRVSPQPDPRMKVSATYLDIFGEIYTDSLLVQYLHEFPAVRDFVILQRLFWFGRRGFRDNPQSAMINTDNDSWLSCLVWNRLQAGGALYRENRRWTLLPEKITEIFASLSQDVENLGKEVLQQPTQQLQDELCQQWMNQEVANTAEHHFVLPKDLREAYLRCVSIEEVPHFIPLTQNISLEAL